MFSLRICNADATPTSAGGFYSDFVMQCLHHRSGRRSAAAGTSLRRSVMLSIKHLQLSLVLGASVASGTALATGPDRFLNGQSYYGQPADGIANEREVDVLTTKYVNARYGETVRFVSEGKSFSWQFNGLDSRRVDLQHIAPAGFAAKPLTVYIGQNPLNRH
jgi:hypothetical protein